MKRIKFSGKLLAAVSLTVLLLSACSTPTQINYFQDLSDGTSVQAAHAQTITLQPLDQISIIVNSRDPQLAAMFNLPYYTRRIGDQQALTSANQVSSTQNISGYTVDSKGEIDFPVLGKIKVSGMKREELGDYIKDQLLTKNLLKDPVVTVEYMNLGVTVLGEVTRPGRYKIDRDMFTIFDAIGLAGDLTINGNRNTVTVIRHNETTDSQDDVYRLDLTSGYNLYASPAYYIQQSDIVYVEPNDKRARESTVNGNNTRSTSFWISLASLLTSVCVLLFK